jgi:hypothetical protein
MTGTSLRCGHPVNERTEAFPCGKRQWYTLKIKTEKFIDLQNKSGGKG